MLVQVGMVNLVELSDQLENTLLGCLFLFFSWHNFGRWSNRSVQVAQVLDHASILV